MPTSGAADLLLKSQSLPVFILFLLPSVNPAKVLLNFPLLSMEKHLPFAGILIVRTKPLLATGVLANRVEPAERAAPHRHRGNAYILLLPSLKMWGKGKCKEGCFVRINCLSPLQGLRFDHRAKEQSWRCGCHLEFSGDFSLGGAGVVS